MAASSAMYGQDEEGGEQAGQEGPVDGEVVDAEFEVKD